MPLPAANKPLPRTALEPVCGALAALAHDSRKQVKYLNAIARIIYQNTPDKLRAWQSASHVERDPAHAAAKPADASSKKIIRK